MPVSSKNGSIKVNFSVWNAHASLFLYPTLNQEGFRVVLHFIWKDHDKEKRYYT